MLIFLTGATGFIGSAIIPELLKAGHQVLGLTRSDAGAQALTASGVQVHRGDLENLESLRTGAEQSEGVIHCGFVHDFSNFAASCETDRRAIEAMGSVLKGSNRPLIASAGVGQWGAPGKPVTENDLPPAQSHMPRVSEQAVMSLVLQGVNAGVMRMPQVHDTVKQGLVTYLVSVARQKGVSAYVGDGSNRWTAAHVSDVARLYRLAIEKIQAGDRFHAIAEQAVPVRDIAEALGKGMKIPVVSLSPEKAQEHFGPFLGMFAGLDLWASGEITQKKLDWRPKGPGLIQDLNNMRYA